MEYCISYKPWVTILIRLHCPTIDNDKYASPENVEVICMPKAVARTQSTLLMQGVFPAHHMSSATLLKRQMHIML